MKILYTCGHFANAPQQVMMYGVNLQNKPVEDHQIDVEKKHPESCTVKNNIFDNAMKAQPAELGDVIWTQSSGNKYIGHAILQKSPVEDIDIPALKLCLKSLERKCLELGQYAAAIPILSPDGDLGVWNKIYPIIEDTIKEIDIIVNVPDEEGLYNVLRSIGGEITQFKVSSVNRPFIRFR